MTVRFLSKSKEIENVYSFHLEPPEPINWQPGQYMHYALPLTNPDEKGNERWFTISAAPFEKNIQITTRFDNLPVSSFKQYLMNLKQGDEIETEGPKGKFILREGDVRHILIAGGIGITPYRSMAAQSAHDGRPLNADLLYANRGEDFVFDSELSDIAAKDSTFHITKFVDKRITEEDLQPYLKLENAAYYLSGPRAMVESYESLLPSLGVSPDNIMTDYFPGY
jgi:ferredoxin-NADP reductase